MNIKNKRSFYGFVVLFVVIVVISVIKLWSWRAHEATWEEFYWGRDLDSLIYAVPSEMNENDIVFVIDKELSFPILSQFYIPAHFVIRPDLVGRARLWGGSFSSVPEDYDWKNINFHVYDIITRERIRTIDLLSLLDVLEEDVIEEFGYTQSTLVYELEAREDGELYLGFLLSEIESNSLDRRYLWLRMNFHTDEVTLEESFSFERQNWTRAENRDFSLQMDVLSLGRMWNVGNYDIFLINGIEIEAWGDVSLPNFTIGGAGFPGTAKISLQAILLPEESQSLYSRFPGLRQFQGREDLEVNVVITGYPTAEEILEMFMEDGREISFEGLRLRYDWSIDGEEHEINSFEDFFRLRDISWWDED